MYYNIETDKFDTYYNKRRPFSILGNLISLLKNNDIVIPTQDLKKLISQETDKNIQDNLKDALKDIIRGFSILSDDYFSVGDVVKYENIEGKVLVIGLKTTKIRSIIDQNVIAIANRNIEKIQVVSKQLDIEVPLSYELKKSEAEKVITEAVFNIQNSLKVDKCEYRGINKMDDSSLNYLIRICCNQETKPQTRRDSICIIIDTLEKHGIEIPYNQIDVHNK